MTRLLSWLLNLMWCGVLLAVSPVVLYRCLRHGKYRHSLRERFLGALPRSVQTSSTVPRYWFHAVSVGEVLLLETVLKEMTERQPAAEFVISATTHTGLDVARRRFPDHTVCCFPLDFSWAVRQAIQRIRPTQIVLVELELWPNFILEAARTKTPLSLINGRLSERSFRGYSRAGWLMRRLIRSFDRIAVQNTDYARRFEALGAPVDRVTVTGSVKYDRVATDRSNFRTDSLRTIFGLPAGDPVFVAGSTVEPEEQIVLDAWQSVRRQHPQLRLILVPRHAERFESVAQLVTARGLPLQRRSQSVGTDLPSATAPNSDPSSLSGGRPPETPSVILLDTLGELSACWGLADFAFVGGSMARRGGQNMIEPAGYGAAICFGPDTRNFRDVVDALLACRAARVVSSSAHMENTLQAWLASPESAAAQGRRAQNFVLSQLGATAKTVDCLLGPAPQKCSSRRVA
ncbi:MAG: 3-deoxy-D-manno-octulosonic acid transferase [Planctomycetaceae bacterium]